MKCPACRQPLSKRKQRELSPLQWQKLQVAYWASAYRRLEQTVEELKEKPRKK